MKTLAQLYARNTYLGYCEKKGHIFSCHVRPNYYQVVAYQDGEITVLIGYRI